MMMSAAPVSRVESRWFISRMAALAVVFLALIFLAGRFYYIVSGQIYPSIHMVMEFASIIVAMSVSLMSWYDYRYNGEARVLILSVAFAMVGLVDFAHSLSYLGMPDFITPNSVNKASTYWIMARILQAVGILGAVWAGQRIYRAKRSGLIPWFSIVVASLVVYLAAVSISLLPPMYDAASGVQTPLKIYLEYFVIALMSYAVLLLLRKKEKDSRDFYLGAALLAGIMGELAFTFYANAYDSYNFLGHIYKTISFAFILKALLEEALAEIYQANLGLERKSHELAEANRQLRLADRLKNNFLANTNHELKSPLSAIVAFTEMMLDEKNTGKLNDLQRDYLKEISDSSRVLLSKISGLLYLTGILGGKVVLNHEKVSLKDLAADVVDTYRSTFRQKELSLGMAVEEDVPVFGDREKISRILVNLLENAFKFTDPGGAVEVRVGSRRESGEACFSVSDTGVGIDPGQQESIYSMFYQVDGASTRKYGGTGIGLTLALKLTEMHGGRIELESEYGRGSTFTVVLPLPGPEEA